MAGPCLRLASLGRCSGKSLASATDLCKGPPARSAGGAHPSLRKPGSVRRVILPGIAFALIAVMVLWVMSLDENTLVTHSRRLLTSQYWVAFDWLDNDHLLYREYHNPRAFKVLNVQTGSIRTVVLADPGLRKAQPLLEMMLPRPDGKSFVTFMHRERQAPAAWVVSLGEGAEKASSEKLRGWPDGRFVTWLDDGASLLLNTSRYGSGDFPGVPSPLRYTVFRWPALTRKSEVALPPLANREGADQITWGDIGWYGGRERLTSSWGRTTQMAELDPFSGQAMVKPVELPSTSPSPTPTCP
jgi:hypothetical protein